MVRKLAILAICVLLVAAAYASAAGLGVSGGSIQAGVDGSLYCDPDGVFVLGWGFEFDDGLVYFVRIGGVNGACAGNDLWVAVESGGGSLLGSGSATIDGSTQYVINFSPAVNPVDIEKIKVWIEGGA